MRRFRHFTSRTIFLAPDASFFDMTEDAISGTESTVAVTSRRAYIFLSAGTRSAVCATTAMPILRTCKRKASAVRDML